MVTQKTQNKRDINIRNKLNRFLIFSSKKDEQKYKDSVIEIINKYRDGIIPRLDTTENLIIKLFKSSKNVNKIKKTVEKYELKKLDTLLSINEVNKNGTHQLIIKSNNKTEDDIFFRINNYESTINFIKEKAIIYYNKLLKEYNIKPTVSITVRYVDMRDVVKEEEPKRLGLFLKKYKTFDNKKVEIRTFEIFKKFSYKLYNKNNVMSYVGDVMDDLDNKIQEILTSETIYVYDGLLKITFKGVRYSPTKGSSYIKSPSKIEKGTVNIKNDDQKCFMWCYLASKYPQEKDPQRVSKYKKYENEVNNENIHYPMTIDDIPLFEQLNNVSCNVFSYNSEKHVIKPLYMTEKRKENHFNTLLINDTEENYHYILIKNLQKLIRNHYTSDHSSKVCELCLTCFKSNDKYQKHIKICDGINNNTIDILPEKKDSILEFKNHKNKLKCPVAIYADFECLTSTINDKVSDSSIKLQKHIASGYCMNIITNNKSEIILKSMDSYNDEIVDNFIQTLLEKEELLMDYIKQNIKMNKLTKQQEKEFENSVFCHICKREIKGKKVRDHDHQTGEYRGAACNSCNLHYHHHHQKIPVIFHNLKGYDSHLIIKKLHKYIDDKHEFTVIPTNKEKYISFTFGNYKFIDSFSFLSSSLDKLVSNSKDLNIFNNLSKGLKKYYNNINNEDINIMKRKGVFPYDYCNSYERLINSGYPNMIEFYSTLYESNINHEDYYHGLNVFYKFKCKNFKDYHDLYLLTDVLLLSDVFENFRNISINDYGLDPIHYYTLPGFAWDCMLSKTKIKFELFTDEQHDMHLFVERGMRGGISVISKRYSSSNNKYMTTYDKNKDDSYIIYLDCNSLYGCAMMDYLPYCGFKWSDISIDEVLNTKDDSDIGYFVECSLIYDEDLHELHNDYPLAPEKMTVDESYYSDQQKYILEKLDYKPCKSSKLIPNLKNKDNYVCHYRNLKFYVEQGLIIDRTKPIKILQFNQKPFMKEYIDFNTEKRSKSKNDFEKDFYKLMSNAVFGKTMENTRRRIQIKFAVNEKQVIKICKNERYKDFNYVDDSDLIIFEMRKTEVYLDKPIYVGASILDLSKIIMYDFHYNTIKKQYQNNAQLLFTDTDSLCYEIKTNDLYKDFEKIKDKLDTSDYDKSHPLFSTDNKKIPGKFKDETNGNIIKEFVGLKSKMYSILLDNNKNKNTCKGTTKTVKDIYLKHDKYKSCLENIKIECTDNHVIRSINHQLYLMKMNKIALNPFDDKRYILNDNITTLAYGHKQISK